MNEPWGVSIIVVNYNNAEFLATAIDSALGQDHPICEVIVVDDCSTDGSQAVIARYGDRIRSLFRQTNGGQTAALNTAWPLARYPILIFLNSDDVLLQQAASTFASRWSDEIVKMQAPLVSIDKAGRPLGNVAPKYPPNLDTAIRVAAHWGLAQLSCQRKRVFTITAGVSNARRWFRPGESAPALDGCDFGFQCAVLWRDPI